jgi:sec-independent protein translocase protein TatA
LLLEQRAILDLMPNIGWQGALVIILVLLLVFGPKRLPEMGRSLGRGMREFKDSITGNDKDDQPENAELTPTASSAPVPPDAAPRTKSEKVSS